MLKFWGDILLMNSNKPAAVATKEKKQEVRAIWRFGEMRKNAITPRKFDKFGSYGDIWLALASKTS